MKGEHEGRIMVPEVYFLAVWMCMEKKKNPIFLFNPLSKISFLLDPFLWCVLMILAISFY